ncbi:MAG: transglycosylase domain-containing protein [Erysipelotrichaceae bacterium]
MKTCKRFLRFLLVVGLAFGIVFAGIGFLAYREVTAQEPLEEKVAAIMQQENYVPIQQISPYILEATIVLEDRRFMEHEGVDIFGLGRAVVNLVSTQSIQGGGSTISQQLAKNLYFGFETSFLRKVAELFVVYELEKTYSKQTILELYLNIINYGDQHIGIGEACWGYFGVSPWDVSLSQASLVVGIPNAPSLFQLSTGYEQALQRQAITQAAMIKYLGYEDIDFEY